MKEGIVMLVGPIGSFKLPDGTIINGIQLKDIVARITSFGDDIDTVRVLFDSPGGREDVGTSIYHYLLSIQPRFNLIHEQIGEVGSVTSKIWFAAPLENRIATEGQDFWIHNPWIPQLTGDADFILAEGAKVKEKEEAYKVFYMAQTGVTEQGIAPLMKAETSFRDQMAVDMKFAGQLQKAHKIAAYMKKPNQEKFNAVIAALKSFFVGEDALSMVAELSDGKKIAFAVEDLSALKKDDPAFSVDESGNPTTTPAPDGVYPMKDGRKVTIAAGKVTVVEGVAAAPTEEVADQALSARMDVIISMLTAKKSADKVLEDKILALVEEKIVALKTSIKAPHIPPAFEATKKTELIAEWDRSLAAGEHLAMRKDDPEKWTRLYFAKHDKMPKNV